LCSESSFESVFSYLFCEIVQNMSVVPLADSIAKGRAVQWLWVLKMSGCQKFYGMRMLSAFNFIVVLRDCNFQSFVFGCQD
jgi:hypothetical protein